MALKIERVGPRFDPARLQKMLSAHVNEGGTVLEGPDAVALLRSLGPGALYWPREGGPGTIVLHPDTTRLEATEEFLHLEQYRARGWPTSNPAINPLLRLEIELEAQDRLLEIARDDKWTDEEVDKISANRAIWRAEYAKMTEQT